MPKNKSKQFSSYNWYKLVDGTRFKARDEKDAIEYAVRLNTFTTGKVDRWKNIDGIEYIVAN